MIRSVVVFPQPLEPSKAINSPSLTSRLMSFTGLIFLYDFSRFFNVMVDILYPPYLTPLVFFIINSANDTTRIVKISSTVAFAAVSCWMEY